MRGAAAALAIAAALTAAPGHAACRLALALGFDVSRSVDAADYFIQKAGLVAALRDEAIRRAFLSSEDHVALAVFEWSGRRHQEVVVGWTEVTEAAVLDRVIARIEAHERAPVSLPTALGDALVFAHGLFRDAPPCPAETLDLSGDGRWNDGVPPHRAYDQVDYGDRVVNGLAILGHEADLVEYYAAEVIRGAGAFVEVARTHRDFPRAIRRKLERELTAPVMGGAARGRAG